MRPTTIKSRLSHLAVSTDSDLVRYVLQQLEKQHYQAQFSSKKIEQWCSQFALSPIELALSCLPIAACYAQPPISDFYVGAVAIGQSGKFYFGANQEFANIAIQQSVHAEQSAISHALIAGEKGITDMIVNYTPCGHCRQFMNELNTATQLKIHLPHSQNNRLHNYLPDAFGPKDLKVDKCLFDFTERQFPHHNDPLIAAAINAASRAYAPYSQALSGIALQVGDNIITGQYAENAAFNPSFLPLQSALNYRRLSGLEDVAISRIVLAETKANLSHKQMTEMLAKELLNLTVEYITL